MNQAGGDYLTREELLVTLFTAIAKCSEVQQLLRMIAVGVEKHQDVSHLSEQYKREKEKAKELAAAESISTEDAARLARQYPWLLA